jgi:glycosyltransferase involved in cell wall biosynthesis
VLLIKFSRAFGIAAALLDLSRLQQHYQVVLEPSWAGYCTPEVMAWCDTGRKVIVQSSARSDRYLLEQLGKNLVPVEFGASDWVDHRVFRPLELDKEFDSVYVANLTKNKRIHIYLRAVARAARVEPTYRGALVCSSWGGRRSTLDALMAFYGVQSRIRVYHQVTQGELNEILNRSKVNVLMSLKEGSNKSLFESMFAGTPALALRENSSINHSYVNEQTGRLVSEQEIAQALLQFRSNWSQYRPRQWALANISPQQTTRKLEMVVSSLAGSTGAGGQLLVKVNSPEATYWNAGAGRSLPPVDEIIRPFQIERSDAHDGGSQSIAAAPDPTSLGEKQ